MSKQRVLSNKLISEGNTIAKMQKVHKAQQLIVKKKQQIKDVKEKLTPKFADILYTIDKNKSKTMILDVSSSNFKLVKQLARLYWIRAIKRHGTKLTLKETKLGNSILRNIQPPKADKYKSSLLTALIQVGVGCGVSACSVPFMFSNVLIGLFVLILGIVIICSAPVTEINCMDKVDKNTNDLTVSNCMSVATKFLSPNDLKCEKSILMRYAKQNHKN